VYLNRSLYYVYYVSLDAAYADFSQMTVDLPNTWNLIYHIL